MMIRQNRFGSGVMVRFLAFLAIGFLGVHLGLGTATAQTRRAFVVGIEKYSDPRVQKLVRAKTDAKDIASDLEQIGFDKKNITIANDIRNKADFRKQLQIFADKIAPGDIVFFFFSGHGFSVKADNSNYLLFGDLKSPISFAASKMPPNERKDANLVALRAPSFLDAYETEEVARTGISVEDLQQTIAARSPGAAILVLDACRSVLKEDKVEVTAASPKRRGSRIKPKHKTLPGFAVFYSAAEGEQSVESFGPRDTRRNSLFTQAFREEMLRPGQKISQLGARIRLVVRDIALEAGHQQEPDMVSNLTPESDIMLVGSIGAEKFRLPRPEKCAEAESDWEQVKLFPERSRLERHRDRFDGCRTAELARREMLNLQDGSDDIIASAVPTGRPIDPCDAEAASDQDRARPPEVPGVPFAKIKAPEAIRVCTDAIARQGRVVRFRFNLGRAYQALGNSLEPGTQARSEAIEQARSHLEEAVKLGYVVAMNNLATFENLGPVGGVSRQEATELFKRAANQGLPIAMLNLARRYKAGEAGLERDVSQAYAWFARAAEAGLVSAMTETGWALIYGQGVEQNPRRGMEWLQRAADAGSSHAAYLLGWFYNRGFYGAKTELIDDIRSDHSMAVLWFARAAEAGHMEAQVALARMIGEGKGIPTPQPEISERYWRLAANSGHAFAQFEIANRIQQGHLLVKPENEQDEALKLLERAMTQGLPSAALALARLHRTGGHGVVRDIEKALQYAFRAIELSVEARPTQADYMAFHEIGAGILISEIALSADGLKADGTALFTEEEKSRLEKFYGKVDTEAGRVKVRRLWVPLQCSETRRHYAFLWVWDWGRAESPTEAQFRRLEGSSGCSLNKDMRATLIKSFETAQKSRIAFADLIEQQVKTAASLPDQPAGRSNRRR